MLFRLKFNILICILLAVYGGFWTTESLGQKAKASNNSSRKVAAKTLTKPVSSPKTKQRVEAETELLVTIAKFLDRRNIPNAREGFLRTLEIDPTYPQPRYNLGVLAESENQREEAIKWFTDYLKFDKKSRYAKAARLKLESLQSPPNLQIDKTNRYNQVLSRANRFIKMGFFKEAIAELSEAVKIDDARWEAYAIAASVFSGQGLTAEAEKFQAEAGKRIPADKRPVLENIANRNTKEKKYREYSQKGVNLYRQKKYIASAEAFTQAWQLKPQRSEAAFGAATAFTAGGNPVEAVMILNQLKTNPDTEVSKKAARMLQALTAKK